MDDDKTDHAIPPAWWHGGLWLKRWWRGYHGSKHNHQLCRFVVHNLAVELYAQAERFVGLEPDLPRRIMWLIRRIDAGADCARAYPLLLSWQPRLYLAAPEAEREQIFQDLCKRYHSMVNADEKAGITADALLQAPDGSMPMGAERGAIRDGAAVSLMSRIGQRTLANSEKDAVSGQLGIATAWIAVQVSFGLMAIFGSGYFAVHRWGGAVNASLLAGVSPLAAGGLFLICWMGVLGAFSSTITRLQKTLGARPDAARLRLVDLDSLAENKISVALSLASGAVFALMGYFLFSSGTAEMLGFHDGLFPRRSLDSPFVVEALGTGYRPHVTRPWLVEANAHTPLLVNETLADDAGRPALPETVDAPDEPGKATTVATAEAQSVGSGGAAKGGTGAPPPRTVTIVYEAPGAPVSQPPPAGDAMPCVTDAGPACGAVAVLALRLGLMHAEDLFKMLVWAFIAGFAERLLPDVIDRVLERNFDPNGKKSLPTQSPPVRANPGGGGGGSGGSSDQGVATGV